MNFLNKNFPHKTALILEDGSAVSYAELTDSVAKFCGHIGSGALIFIVGECDYPSLLCYLSSLEVGAVPLLLGSGLHESKLASLIGIYDPQFIFSKDQYFQTKYGCKLTCQVGLYYLYARPGAANPVLHADLALLLATSGSTGSPKLVRLSHQNLLANAESISQYLNIDSDARAITSLPLNYSYGLSVINSHLYAGASLVLTSRSMMDAKFWRLIKDLSVTSLAGVPYNYEILLKLRLANMKIPSVRQMTQAGGRLARDKIQQVYTICRGMNIDFYSMYGQTEATARIAYLPTEDTVRKLGSIGIAIPGGRLWLEDELGKVILDPGVIGELIYEGSNVSLGYAESLDGLALGDMNQGVLRTGDLGHFDEDGYFFIEGRKHRFLKIFGIRISLDAVEKMVAEKGYACAANGTDDRLMLYVVEAPQLRITSLRADMAESLGINQVGVDVRLLKELPRLETGKIDYQCLSQLP